MLRDRPLPINPLPTDTSPDEFLAEDYASDLREVLRRLPVAGDEVRPLHVKLHALMREIRRHM